uniref:Uncharacterized protein n=1 Tax=Fagus sylvatica TaxID=28930 RepID=A0A2N9GAV2_FAGSY
MAKVAAAGSLTSNSLQIGGGTGLRRKTPSELRGEQLKQTHVIEIVDESPAPLVGTTNEVDNGLKKPEMSKNPRYIDTRMDEVFPVKKSRFKMLSGKENAKENNSIEQSGSLKNISLLSTFAAKRRHQLSSQENSVASAQNAKDGVAQAFQTIGKCSQSTFRSVSELSSVNDRSSGLATIDMDWLPVTPPPAISGLNADSSERPGDPTSLYSGNFCSECHLPGRKAPLDFTLKTHMRMVSSSPVNRIHRSIMSGTMPQFTHSKFGHSEDQNNSHSSVSTSHVLSSKVMHSWVYPQSTLPSSLISVLTSSAAAEGVCSLHFVVMFNGGDGSGRNKRSCNAYISRSTRGLRSLLREHKHWRFSGAGLHMMSSSIRTQLGIGLTPSPSSTHIVELGSYNPTLPQVVVAQRKLLLDWGFQDICFSMPLCHSKEEQVTTEDLVELSEIEKHNLGQTRRLSSLSDIDSSSQSLLVFSGNKNVHGLYDFLLNYRSFLTSLTAMDVPLLCSPVPFQNAALSAPEVRCMELKRADHIAAPKGVMGSEGRSFEASFINEPTSVGLNVALGATCKKSDSQAVAGVGLQESSYAFGIPEAIVTPSLCSGLLKGLRYSNSSYTASLSPI